MDGVAGGLFQESRKDEMLTFFFQLITMTKHMVDDILPELLLLLDEPTIESVVRCCDEFDGSLHVFQKLCGVITRRNVLPAMKQLTSKNHKQTGFAANTHGCLNVPDSHVESNESPLEKPAKPVSDSSNIARVDSKLESHTDVECAWKAVIAEAMKHFASKKEITSFHYCGLCNIRCLVKNTWDEHVKGKRHVARCGVVVSHNMHCETCGLNILSDFQHISLILESPEHRLIDEMITREKLACETNKSDQQSVDLTVDHKQTGFSANTHGCLNEPDNHTESNESPLEKPAKPISDSSDLAPVDSDRDDDCVWKVLIAEAMKHFASKKEITSFHYCGLCNIRCLVKNTWDEHVKGKRHVARCGVVVSHNMHCETCGLNILSDVQHILLILESPEHRLIDEMITREKLACETNKSDQQSVDLTVDHKHTGFAANTHGCLNEPDNHIESNESPLEKPAKPISDSSDLARIDSKLESDTDDDCAWKALIAGAMKHFASKKEITSFHFCGLCNIRCLVRNNWDDHLKGRRHVARCGVVVSHNMHCETCGLNILSDVQHISLILESPEHRLIDEMITREKLACETNKSDQQSVDLTPPKVEPKSESQNTSKAYDEKIVFEGKSELSKQKNGSGGSSKQSSFMGSTESMHSSKRSSVKDESFTQVLSVSDQEMPSRNAQLQSVIFHLKSLDNASAPLKEGRRASAMASQGSGRSSLESSQRSLISSNNNSHRRVESPLDMDVSVTDGRTGYYGDDVFKTSRPSSAHSDKRPKNSKRPPPSQDSSQCVVSDVSDFISPFIVLLRQKEIKFREDPSFKPFAALCLLCPSKTFSSAFEWCAHIADHSSNDSQNEVRCSFCNTHIFGDVEEINRVLIPHDEHCRINKLMYSV